MMATCIMLPIPHAADPTTPAPVSWLMGCSVVIPAGCGNGSRPSIQAPAPGARFRNASRNCNILQLPLLINLCLRTQLRLCLAAMSCAILIRVALVR